MNEVYLTISIEKKDLNSADFDEFVIINAWEILEEKGYDLLKDNNDVRINHLISEIDKRAEKILICNAGFNVEDLNKISLNLKSKVVNKIIMPSQDRREKQLAESIEFDRKHNRWTNFYPGELEDNYNNFGEILSKIKNNYIKHETKVVEV